MTTRCAIIGCGAQKLDLSGDKGPVFISRLYTSNYFELKRKFAKECCDRYYILSAKHGLVAPDHMVAEDYDLTVGDLEGDELEQWVRDIADRLAHFGSDVTLVMLAGQDYIQPLQDALDNCPATVEYPFDDTGGIGEQMGWLKTEIEAATATDDAADPTDDQEGLGRWA